MSSISFDNAPEVKEMAIRLIGQHHSHLVEAKIKYLFRSGAWVVCKETRLGSSQKCTGKEKFMTGYDFIMTINWDEWIKLDAKQREALVDHELLHCCRGEDDEDGYPTWYTQDHTFKGFPQEIRRHGMWLKGLQMMKTASDEHKQLSMFDEHKELRKAASS